MIVSLAAFFFIAVIYSAVGFGGGSSYIAVLALLEYPYEHIPVIALVCNLVVVAGGVYHFTREGHFNWTLFWPYALSSIPMAYIGGRIPIGRELFLSLLGFCLLMVGIGLLVRDLTKSNYENIRPPNRILGLLIGGSLGMLSGTIGIGGGIFLAPVLLHLRWGLPKQISATAAMFILLNSLSGLGGQLVKHGSDLGVTQYWPLLIAVFLGGQIGSRMGSGPILSQRLIKMMTALLVLFVAIRILWSSI